MRGTDSVMRTGSDREYYFFVAHTPFPTLIHLAFYIKGPTGRSEMANFTS